MKNAVLLCSAAATGLSAVAKRLDGHAGIAVADLEEVLKGNIGDWGGYSPSMGRLCSMYDRDAVLDLWAEAFDSAASDLVADPHSETAVLACHLTLFSPERLEFYSPPLLRAMGRHPDFSVSRVVVLIDDIYDMYSRLAESLYKPTRMEGEHKDHAGKLTQKGGVEPDEFSDKDLATLAIEIRVKNLLRLLHWRRSEMIAAEELARNLGVPLTVLSVKHEMDSLVSLLTEEDARPVYLSHKITEPRGYNTERTAAGRSHEWPVLTRQVNALAPLLRERNIVIIQPTAIDELRFAQNANRRRRLDRFSGVLVDRWPIPDGSIYARSSDEAPGHYHLLDQGRTDHDAYRHGLYSLLQHSIYDEIAFRDHLLVSCNVGLLVFRPGAMGARISGGVEREIGHWVLSATNESAGNTFRPLVLVHAQDELKALIESDELSWMFGTLEKILDSQLKGLSVTATHEVWTQCVILGRQVEDVEGSLSSHLGRLGGDALRPHLEEAATRAVAVALTALFGISEPANKYAAHVVAESEASAVSAETMGIAASLLTAPSLRAVDDANHDMVTALIEYWEMGDVLTLARWLATGSVQIGPSA